MALPKFYLETRNTKDGKQPINMFYSFNGQRLQYYCKHRIDPKYYKDYKKVKNVNTGEMELVKIKVDRSDINKLISDQAPYATQIKDNLKQIALDVQNIVNLAKANRTAITPTVLKAELDKIHKPKEEQSVPIASYDFISFYEKIIQDSKTGGRVMKKGRNAGKKYSHNAIKNYGSSLSAVKRFMSNQKIKRLDFSDINKQFYEKFRHFCYDVEQKEISTFSGLIKDIKSVMNEAHEAELQDSNGHKAASFVLPTYKPDTIYLNEEQLLKISDLDLSDSEKFETIDIVSRDKEGKAILNKAGEVTYKKKKVSYKVLDKARDLFIIGAWSGLRFGNYSNLEPSDIQGDFIILDQIKTGSEVKIYIPKDKLRPTIDKYKEGFPTLSNQKFNDYIKIVARLAGLTENVTVKSFRGNIETINNVPLYKLVSSHAARRSFATNMYKRGKYTEGEIMSITGHKSTSSFYRYIRATNHEIADNMARKMQADGL